MTGLFDKIPKELREHYQNQLNSHSDGRAKEATRQAKELLAQAAEFGGLESGGYKSAHAKVYYSLAIHNFTEFVQTWIPAFFEHCPERLCELKNYCTTTFKLDSPGIFHERHLDQFKHAVVSLFENQLTDCRAQAFLAERANRQDARKKRWDRLVTVVIAVVTSVLTFLAIEGIKRMVAKDGLPTPIQKSILPSAPAQSPGP